MILFNLLFVLLTILVVGYGLYFLEFKKNKNRNSFIIGYLYLLFGVVGLVVTIMVLI